MGQPPVQPLHANLPVLENFDLTAVVDQDVHSEKYHITWTKDLQPKGQ